MEESRTKSFAKNSFFSIINQLIVMISGFIIPRFMLSYYGSEVNGLVSSITQFINYFTIVEAGLSGAAIFSLYVPLAKKDIKEINTVVSSAKKYYYQAGYLFTIAVVLLAGVYPFFVKTSSLQDNAVRFLVVMLGAKGFLDFFSLAKYRTLLTADQKLFMISISSSLYTILNTFLISLFAINHMPITLVYAFSLIPLCLRTYILSTYVKKNYPFINYSVPVNKNVLHARWDALFQQFVGMAQNSAPPIIATVFLSLKEVSVYSIYNMVISGINGILTIFTTSLSSSFGNIIAKNETEVLKKTYNEFEFVYLQLIGIVYSVAYILLLPFVNLYTTGVKDTDYNLPNIAVLMVLNGLLYTMKTPQGMLIIAAGHYKETRWRSLTQALLLIFVAIVLAKPMGLEGIIVGAIVSNLYRVLDMLFYVPKKITHLSIIDSLKNYVYLFLTVAITIVVGRSFFSQINTWATWIMYAVIITFISGVTSIAVSIILNRDVVKSLLKRFGLMKVRK